MGWGDPKEYSADVDTKNIIFVRLGGLRGSQGRLVWQSGGTVCQARQLVGLIGRLLGSKNFSHGKSDQIKYSWVMKYINSADVDTQNKMFVRFGGLTGSRCRPVWPSGGATCQSR